MQVTTTIPFNVWKLNYGWVTLIDDEIVLKNFKGRFIYSGIDLTFVNNL